jgi:hypothetical protein
MDVHFAALSLLAILQSSTAPNPAEISGRVIDSASNQPLAGARVILYRLGSETYFNKNTIEKADPTTQPQDPASPVLSMFTGDDGRFSFKVEPARFSLHARNAGYLDWGDDAKTSKFLALKPGQKMTGVVIVMEQPVSITGRVIDPETEQSVPGLLVLPMAWLTMGASRALVFAGEGATTDKNGAYALKGLGPGEYILEVAPAHGERFLPGGTDDEFRSGAQPAYLRSYYPGVERREQAESVTLLPGVALDRIDFKLSKRRAAAIRGCLHAEGSPDQLGDVALGLTLIEIQGGTSMYNSVADKTVRADACFKLEGLAAGKYYLNAETKAAKPTETQRAFLTLDLDDQRLDHVDLNLMKGIPVNGKVRLAETVTGTELKELHLKIQLYPRGRSVFGDELGEESLTKVSEATGAFAWPNVFPGAFDVLVVGLPDTLAVGEVFYNSSRAGRKTFVMNPGAPDQRLEVVLHPATGSINVTVAGGEKATDSQLVLRPEPYNELDPNQEAQTITADSDGRGAFAHLLAGKYRLFAFPPGVAWRTNSAYVQKTVSGMDVDVGNDATQTVEVKPSEIR